MLKGLSIALSLAALAEGLVAAWYWYKASAVEVKAVIDDRFGGAMAVGSNPFVAGALDAIERSSKLNKTAALWTGASVICSGLASVAGAFSN